MSKHRKHGGGARSPAPQAAPGGTGQPPPSVTVEGGEGTPLRIRYRGPTGLGLMLLVLSGFIGWSLWTMARLMSSDVVLALACVLPALAAYVGLAQVVNRTTFVADAGVLRVFDGPLPLTRAISMQVPAGTTFEVVVRRDPHLNRTGTTTTTVRHEIYAGGRLVARLSESGPARFIADRLAAHLLAGG